MRSKNKGTLLTLVAVLLIVHALTLVGYAMEHGARAEWDTARAVLMHTPSLEFLFGVMHPSAALYERPFAKGKARQEHEAYMALLREEGVSVYTVAEVLFRGTVDENGTTIEGEALDRLRSFARRFLTYDTSRLWSEEANLQEVYKDDVIGTLGPKELIDMILLRPTVYLETTDSNTGLFASYQVEPVMNLFFCRDQMITTALGVVLGRMNSPQRAAEVKIMKFVLEILGMEPIYEVVEPGYLEGGDYFSVGDFAFIGQGLRTNEEAIFQLLEHQVFGVPYVVVVKDSWQDQEQMHLDTYFNIIGKELAVMVDTRLELPGKPKAEGITTLVDVYFLRGNAYEKMILDRDFQVFLEEDLGFTIIPVTVEDQRAYGINFLTLRENRILGVDGVSKEYKDTLEKHGVHATWLDFRALTGGYGAAHCMTQVFLRR